MLSDGAFKLYVYVCLQAERSSGRLRFRQNELAQSLGKSPRSITSYLKELQRQDVCQVQAAANQHQRGSIEIADCFWPYHKRLSETPLSSLDSLNGFGKKSRYIEQVRQLFLSRACVQGTFSAADEKLATAWYQCHVPLEQVERAYLLGCARKYIALNHPGATLISCLHYFTALLSEVVELKVSADYWSYLSHKVDRLERSWRLESAVLRVGPANFAPPNRRTAIQNKGETRLENLYLNRQPLLFPSLRQGRGLWPQRGMKSRLDRFRWVAAQRVIFKVLPRRRMFGINFATETGQFGLRPRTQTRTFTYDSLGRLLTADNPKDTGLIQYAYGFG